MKTSRIVHLMKATKCAIIMRKGYSCYSDTALTPEELKDGEGAQWFSNGSAAYKMDDAPIFKTAQEWFSAYDMDECQQEQFHFQFDTLPPACKFERWDTDISGAVRLPVSLTTESKTYELFSYAPDNMAEQVLFIDSRYLSMFDGKGEGTLEYGVKNGNLVVFEGIYIAAVIGAVNLHDDEVYNAVTQAQRQMQRNIMKDSYDKRRREEETARAESRQESMYEDE